MLRIAGLRKQLAKRKYRCAGTNFSQPLHEVGGPKHFASVLELTDCLVQLVVQSRGGSSPSVAWQSALTNRPLQDRAA
jgi:hypothetical protein